MRLTIKAFGITREIIGEKEKVLELESGTTVSSLKAELEVQYPELKGLKSLFIAVNNKYEEEDAKLNENDEIALIPPVSGG
jgi:molybdopterin synthase sulfur carrier subunit